MNASKPSAAKKPKKVESDGAARDTALRYIAMLATIPQEPHGIGTAQIAEKLGSEGHNITKRTIQRDLEKLSAMFPLITTQEGRANLWSFRKGSPSQWPAMSVDAALNILLVEKNLKDQLPKVLWQTMEPLVAQARATLQTLDKKRYKSVLTDKMRVLPRGIVLKKPDIAESVLNAVQEALARDRQLDIDWHGKPAHINPLALVVRGGVVYLVCTFEGGSGDIRTPALHRIPRAQMLASTVKVPVDFDLDRVISSGRLMWILGDAKPQRFEIEVEEGLAHVLEETPFNDTQEIDFDYDDDLALVTFDACYTMELRQWLLGFSDQMALLKPVKIRREIGKLLKDAAEWYGD